MRKSKLIILMMLLTAQVAVMGQKFSNRGRDFWTGYALHYFMEIGQDNSQQMVLYFSAEEAANVKVTTRGVLANTVTNYFVPANSVIASNPMPKSGSGDCRLYDVPPSFGGQGSDRLFDRSIHIESDVPIVAYAHISGAASSGATMLMPVESWGYSYMSVNSQQAVRVNPGGDGCFSWLFVVADHDNTVVEITPSVTLRNGAPAGQPFTTTLNRGQIYQVVGAAITPTTGEDLTGTKVKSVGNNAGECYPIAVFVGSSSTAITCNGSINGAADNLIQQIFPVQAWGKNYLTAPFSASTDATILNPCIYRVAVRDPATIVKRNGIPLTGLTRNAYYEFQSTTADFIEADKPVLVTQYMPSMSNTSLNTGCNFTGLGDPEMVYLSPVEQAINRIGFYRNTEAVVEVNYLTLVIPTAGLSSLTIDGSASFSHTYLHPNRPGYTVVVRRWPAAKAQCIVQSDSAFTAITYGMGSYDSYAYNAGTMINNLNGSISLHNVEGAAGEVHPFTCRNSPVELAVLIAYQPTRLVWHLSQLAYMTPNTDIIQNSPVAAGTVVHKGRTYFKYTIPGTYTFSEAGTFRFAVSSTHPDIDNCNNTEDLLLDVVVKDLGQAAAFNYTQSGCLPDLVKLQWDAAYAGGYTVNRWLWTFPDGSTDNKSNTEKLFTASGIKDIRLKIITAEGCVADSMRQVTVQSPVTMGIIASTANACKEDVVNFSAIVMSGTMVVDGWYWDFGDGRTSTEQNPTNTYAQPGTYTVKMVGKSGSTCMSDTVTFILNVWPAPQAAFGVTADVCLGGAVAFDDQSQPATGASLASWAWDFGDNTTATYANSDPFNKTYAAKGTYTAKLTVTDNRGCAAATTMPTTVHPLPETDFLLPAVVCMPKGEASFTNRTAPTENKPMTWQWNFGDATAPSTAQHPTHVYAAAGNYEVSLTATSAYGCSHTVTHTLSSFAAQPQAAFSTAPATICQGSPVDLTDLSMPVTGTISAWNWDFGDGTNAMQQSPVKTYTKPGTYTVQLTVSNTAGCLSDPMSKALPVRVQPVVDAGPAIHVAQGTLVTLDPKVNDPSLTLQWSPANLLSNPHILKPSYIANHDQVFTLTASDGSCTASDQVAIKILLPVIVPNAFTPNGDGVNDTWVITNLNTYQGNTVQVFNRYGQQVFYSAGYGMPWDGRVKGNPLPVGVYYYVIDLKNGFGKLTGSVTILR
jgi:gliding motility-associated-like protein